MSEMNEPVCTECGLNVKASTVTGCWEDQITPDHKGLCCDCFDTLWYAAPAKIKLEGKTPRNLTLHDEYDEQD